MVTIYSLEISPRIDYVVKLIFKNILGLDFIITNELNDLNEYDKFFLYQKEFDYYFQKNLNYLENLKF